MVPQTSQTRTSLGEHTDSGYAKASFTTRAEPTFSQPARPTENGYAQATSTDFFREPSGFLPAGELLVPPSRDVPVLVPPHGSADNGYAKTTSTDLFLHRTPSGFLPAGELLLSPGRDVSVFVPSRDSADNGYAKTLSSDPSSPRRPAGELLLPRGEPAVVRSPGGSTDHGFKAARTSLPAQGVTCPQGHTLINLGTSRDDGWDCDARNEPGGCISSKEMSSSREDAALLMSLLQPSGSSDVGSFSLPMGPTVEASMPDRSSNLASRNALCADPRGPMLTRLGKDQITGKTSELDPVEAPAVVPISQVSWHADWSIRIAPQLDGLSFAKPVKVLEKDIIFSVNQAVDGLNRGLIQCQEDLCAAYSASSCCWFLLFKSGREDLAFSALGQVSTIGSFQAEPVFSSVPQPVEIVQPLQPAEPSMFSPVKQPQQPQPALAAGQTVYIGGQAFHITTALGMGSFGAVWAAEFTDSYGSKRDIAVKEIHCQSSADLQSAMYECKLLEILDQEREGFGGATGSTARPHLTDVRGETKSSRQGCIPAFVATETEQLGPSHWRVRFAMSKVPGIPLDNFLEMRKHEQRPSTSQRLSEACRFTSGLISQLAPTFERISAHALHRDINSHNVLVDVGDMQSPSYGLVDFGLAVDLSSWRGPNVSQSSWHLVDIGGDCRYWPMAAWLQFEGGFQELAKYPGLAVEYENHLDFHAMGITALQVWAAMAYDWNANSRLSRTSGEAVSVDEMPDEATALLTAWGRYWKDATLYWQKLLDCFRNHGDQNALKGWCIGEGVHNTIGQHLADVRTALRMVCDACSTGRCRSLVGQRPLFEALLELISAGGVTGVNEGLRPTWEGVSVILEKKNVVTLAAQEHAPALSYCAPLPRGPQASSTPRGYERRISTSSGSYPLTAII